MQYRETFGAVRHVRDDDARMAVIGPLRRGKGDYTLLLQDARNGRQFEVASLDEWHAAAGRNGVTCAVGDPPAPAGPKPAFRPCPRCSSVEIALVIVRPGDALLETDGEQTFSSTYACTGCGARARVDLKIQAIDWS